MSKVARIGPEQYNSMVPLKTALEKTGFPPPRLDHLLTQQGIDLNGSPVFALRSGGDYLYCNATDDTEADGLFKQYLASR